MKTVILTSDSHSWLLKGFFHQWEKYNGGYGREYNRSPFDMEVAGFTNPGCIPPDVMFCSIGNMGNYPVGRWSDALISYLEHTPDELILILLEDYWMIRPINVRGIFDAFDYMATYPNTLRFDVAADRMFNKTAKYIGHHGTLDICSAKNDYSLSFQASVYRRELLLKFLEPSESPWMTEINGTARVNESTYDVVGSYQWPMNYAIVVNKGNLDTTGSWMYPARTLKTNDWEELDRLGCLDREAIR